MKLHRYGIEDEQSDIRAHVSLPGRSLLVYRTSDMVDLVRLKAYPERNATQPGVDFDTAKGWIVPIADIIPMGAFIRSEHFPWDRWSHNEMGCKEKGDMAVYCVKAAIVNNRFPLWVCGRTNADTELDIQGTDIIVSARRRIQVKYDHLAYPKNEGGSGNLFIQTRECNPLKIYGSVELTTYQAK